MLFALCCKSRDKIVHISFVTTACVSVTTSAVVLPGKLPLTVSNTTRLLASATEYEPMRSARNWQLVNGENTRKKRTTANDVVNRLCIARPQKSTGGSIVVSRIVRCVHLSAVVELPAD